MSRLLITLFSLTLFTTSCGMVKSSMEFTNGTKCLEAKNYGEAIQHLENAVMLDPEMGRNYNNLTFAYLETKQMEKAWITSRKSLFCKYPDENACHNFLAVYQKYVYNRGLAQPKTQLCEIREKLGEPDFEDINNDKQLLFYGIAVFEFENNALLGVLFKDGVFISQIKNSR